MSPGGPQEDNAQRVVSQQVAELRRRWGECYKITHDGERFVAERRDDGKTISAVSQSAIHELVRDDYSARPSPPARDTGD